MSKHSRANEQKFFDALRDIFVGARIEGESGYINLMRIKSRYYTEGVFPRLQEKIDEELQPFPAFREELFDKLYSFFKRYFSDSGSIYFRHTPYYQDIYERIYTDDRDVMLFWKTQNLYYVKTDRLFRSLTLNLDDAPDQKFAFDASAVEKKSFNFDASGLQNKRNNEKRNLIFEYKGKADDETLKFAVQYTEGGKKTKTDDILKAIKRDGVAVKEDQLTRAFRLFERQSEVDFFINKNAKAFLEEQFDLWMYQYLFKRESDWTEKRISELQALKRVARSIIEFISQFEDELVRIWNKPKFALSSNYVITFDRVFTRSEELARKMLAHEGIKAQTAEWRELGMIGNDELGMMNDESKQASLLAEDDPSEKEIAFRKLATEFMENSAFRIPHSSFRFLPFDTKHFKSLELEILSLFDNLDAELDGRLIHSENYQALNTLKDKFREKVKCIYIDPPYNTGSDEFIYKDEYRHSAWLSMMENRLSLSRSLMNEEGAIFTSIDDREQTHLKILMDSVFGNENFDSQVIWQKKYSPQNDAKTISAIHDYITVYAKQINKWKPELLTRTQENISRYKNPDNDPRGVWKAGDLTSKTKAAGHSYTIVSPITGAEFTPTKGRQWAPSEDTFQKLLDDNRIWFGANGNNVPALKQFLSEVQQGTIAMTIWWREDAGDNQEAVKELMSLGFHDFESPKPTRLIERVLQVSTGDSKGDYICDFFAGSGTTAHSVINLKHSNNQKRNLKYLLIEANYYFDSMILPRVKKVVFSDKWKDGKAQADGKGASHFCKYFALEQYEDTLRRAVYLNDSEIDQPAFFDNPYESPFASYVFLRDKKMADALTVDYENNKISVDFSKLYADIDLAETLSCIKGKFIKSLTAESVTFADGETVEFDELDYRDILPLIWWDK